LHWSVKFDDFPCRGLHSDDAGIVPVEVN
jgi:hypothetical protein